MTAILTLSVMIVAIYILAIITDEFFIPSLDQIAERWKLPPNVAGASLMAMGSSAPELAIALFALFQDGGAHSDVGVGTIVGSAVFNILVITGVSAIFREAKITLPVIIRDTVFYLGSILLLLVVFWNGKVTTGECLFLLAFYAVYLGFLFFVKMEDEPEPDIVTPEKPAETGAEDSLFRKVNAAVIRSVAKVAGEAETDYLKAFGVSIFFITALSWILVDMAVMFADAVGLPPVVVALTILAGGTSAPDLISSVVVAKQGRGGMAVANAIGSNIFDILVGLGLPWLIALVLLGRPVIEVGTGDLVLSVVILMGTVITLFYFLYTDRLLSRKEGWALLGIYGGYVVWTILAG